MEEIGIELVIDDSQKTCRFASELGITSLLFTTIANSSLAELPNNCVRVESWQQIREFFQKDLTNINGEQNEVF